MNAVADSNRAELRRAVAVLVFITILWGLSFPLVKMNNFLMNGHQLQYLGEQGSAASQIDLNLSAAAVTMALRFGLALILLLVFFPRQFGGLTIGQWLMGAAAGFVFALGMMLQNVALNEISASRCGFLTSLAVVFTPLLMIAVTRRVPTLNVILAVAVALIGAGILTGACTFNGVFLLELAEECTQQIGVGDLLTVLAAAVFALQIIMIDVFSRRMPPALLTPGMFAATLVAGTIFFSIHQLTWTHAPPLEAWGQLLATPAFPLLNVVICLLGTLVPFHYMNKYQAKVTPTQAALIYTLEPIFIIGWALFLPDLLSPLVGVDYPSETLSWTLIGGGGLVIAANVLGFWPASATAEARLQA